jgi:hypothetical protein
LTCRTPWNSCTRISRQNRYGVAASSRSTCPLSDPDEASCFLRDLFWHLEAVIITLTASRSRSGHDEFALSFPFALATKRNGCLRLCIDLEIFKPFGCTVWHQIPQDRKKHAQQILELPAAVHSHNLTFYETNHRKSEHIDIQYHIAGDYQIADIFTHLARNPHQRLVKLMGMQDATQ